MSNSNPKTAKTPDETMLNMLSIMERMMAMQERLVDQLEKIAGEVEELQNRMDEYQIGLSSRSDSTRIN